MLHVYGTEPQLIDGTELDSLRVRCERFFAREAQTHADFRIADFRDSQHNVMAVVEEDC